MLSGLWKDYYPNGKIKQLLYFDKGNLTDSTVSYYPTGNIYQVNKYQHDTLNGVSRTYFESGKLKFEHKYSNGYKEGEQKSYFENGNVKAVFFSSLGSKNGVFQGYYKEKEGVLQKKCSYRNNLLHGDFFGYYKSGNLMNQSNYVYDTISGIYYEFFDSTQRLVSNFGHYIKGSKEEKWIWYYQNQKIYISGDFTNDKKMGFGKFFIQWNIKQRGEYADGKEVGLWEFFNNDGSYSFKGQYLNGLKNGQWTSFYPSGKIKVIQFYKTGLKEGMAFYYDKEGNLIEKAIFKNDTIYQNN